MSRTFVGFGFGAIQTGLFLYEAQKSGNFGRLVVAEVMQPVVDSVRRNGGKCHVNIAHLDGVENAEICGIEIYNPNEATDRERLVATIAEADELCTALPSVKFFTDNTLAAVNRLLAEGFGRSPDRARVVYCAENNNEAAGILTCHVLSLAAQPSLIRTQFLDTVIGKMSGVVIDEAQMREQGLARLTPDSDRAMLVEEFNRILISRIEVPGFQRGLTTFVEKADLGPFEEAKLYGHNATHAFMAYVGAMGGIDYMSEASPSLCGLARKAFLEESGAALIKKYAGMDELFTPAGFRAYVDDLIVRMTNPYLSDSLSRVGRDPERKLGWDDRLVGTIRLALSQGVDPKLYSLAAAAALLFKVLDLKSETVIVDTLSSVWNGTATESAERAAVVDRILVASRIVRHWLDSGKPPINTLG